MLPTPSPDSAPMPPPPSPEMTPPGAMPPPMGEPPAEEGNVSKLTLDPLLLAKAKGEQDCKPGGVYKLNVTVKATDDGEFEVVDTDELMADTENVTEPVEEPKSETDEEESAVLGYDRPASKAKPVKMNASFLKG